MSNKYQKFDPNLYERVIEYVATFTTEPCHNMTTKLKEHLGIDSLELTSLVVGLEDTFGFIFEDTDLDPAKIRTVGDVVRLVFYYNHGYIEEDKKHASLGES